MASRPRFLSRRALLKIAAASTLAPFALSPFGRAEMEAVGMTTFADKVKRDRFYKVAEKFWKMFEDGVSTAAEKKDKIKVEIGPGVFAEAIRLSGIPLFAALDCFGDDGQERERGDKEANLTCVNYCAQIAVDAVAVKPDPKIITPEVFEAAWSLTKVAYGSRICEIKGPPDPNDPPDPIKISAFGC